MVLCWQLRRRKIPAELRLGVQKRAERFEAHAWVELQGVVLNDADETHIHFVSFNEQMASAETTSP